MANVTPFRDDAARSVDVNSYLAHVSWLGEMGVRGIVPFGTNGEGPSIALHEKLRILEALFARDLSVQVIPAVMQGNLPDTLEMVATLEDHPVTAVLVLPPYFFKPASAEGLERFFRPVLEATSRPVIVYHANYAVPVPEEVVTALPVWGVKDSAGEPGYAEAVLRSGKGVLSATEDDLWRRLNSGVQGAISGLANFIPERILEMHEKVKSGDEVGGRALSEDLRRARAMTKEYASSAAVLKKLAEARHGTPMGTVRPPLVPLPADYDPEPVLSASLSPAGS